MKKTPSKKSHQKIWILAIILISCLILGTFFIIKKDTVSPEKIIMNNAVTVDVAGTSMEPRIKDGQKVTYIPDYYRDHPITHGDVVIANVASHSGYIIKEVVAMAGDHWTYSGGNITVNNTLLLNSAGVAYNITSPMLTLYATSYPILPKDTLLILGDQPSGTLDASKFGLIGIGEVVGKVVEY